MTTSRKLTIAAVVLLVCGVIGAVLVRRAEQGSSARLEIADSSQ